MAHVHSSLHSPNVHTKRSPDRASHRGQSAGSNHLRYSSMIALLPNAASCFVGEDPKGMKTSVKTLAVSVAHRFRNEHASGVRDFGVRAKDNLLTTWT
jgi:hypothetical protein